MFLVRNGLPMHAPSSRSVSRTRWATLIGFSAVLMWSSLAVLTVSLGPFPPFEMIAITFGIGGTAGIGLSALRGRLGGYRQPPTVWLLGIGAIFGDYALYFWSLRKAPAAQANLLSYLWPLLMVLFSALLPNERLRRQHVVGAVLGLLAVAVLTVGAEAHGELRARYAVGYGLALGAAVVWGGYSVSARRFKAVPHDTTFGFCLGAALLAAMAHRSFEQTVWPGSALQAVLLLIIGIGPAGSAFFLWDLGIKHGDIRMLGILSYTIPVVSTGLLVLFGMAPPTVSLGIACVLITAGAMVGTIQRSEANRG